MNLLTMEHITKAYTDRVLLNDVAFSINENEKIGVIGINGMGKSTLLKVTAGIEPYDEGKISMGKQVKICYLPQTPEFEEGTTVLRAAIADNVNELNQWTIEADARSMLNQLGFYDYNVIVEHMSGGQKKRIALVNALLTPADILILDEPTNHLDNAMSEWLEEYLIGFRGAILMVTHDRYFLDRVATRIVEVDQALVVSLDDLRVQQKAGGQVFGDLTSHIVALDAVHGGVFITVFLIDCIILSVDDFKDTGIRLFLVANFLTELSPVTIRFSYISKRTCFQLLNDDILNLLNGKSIWHLSDIICNRI